MNRVQSTVVAASLLLAACGGATETAVPRTSLATAQAGRLTVELLADGRLETGLSPVYVKLTTAAQAPVTDAHVTFVPKMTMTSGTSHGAPVFDTVEPGADGLFRADTVFQMASSSMGAWSAQVLVHDHAVDAELTADFPALTVVETGRAKTFTSTDPVTAVTTKYLVSLAFRAAPKVGLNPVLVTAHVMTDMMAFAPAADLTFALDPQMPSMGHGASGSVNPVLVSAGRYEGQLSLSMPGNWETTVTVGRAGGGTLGVVKVLTGF